MSLFTLILWSLAALGVALSVIARTRMQRANSSLLAFVPAMASLLFPEHTLGLAGAIFVFLGVAAGGILADLRTRAAEASPHPETTA